MRAPITDKHLLEMMWERFPEIMKRGAEQPAQQEPVARAKVTTPQPPTHLRPACFNGLVDTDGENKAVRCLLMLYGERGLTVGAMKKHLSMSGFKMWPDWVEREPDGAHLTKSGAQLWIRHLFSLEQPAQQEPVARQYQNRDGVWKDFISEKHYKDTLEDGSWPIRNLYTSPPAQRKPLPYEQDRAICEAYCNTASDDFFAARPQLDSADSRRIFYAGHRKAWITREEAIEAARGIKETEK